MQIGPGQSPLSIAVLKTLGVQLPAGSPATAGGASADAVSQAAGRRPDAAPAAKATPDRVPSLGVSKSIPRGSFVDLKV